MSVMPATPHRLPVRRTTEHLAPKRPRSAGNPYVPGMFDALIDRPVLSTPRPDQVRSVTIELAASGRSVVVAEQLHTGPGPRTLLNLAEPHSAFMRLADGREVWIEVRAVEQVPEEDREPWSDEESGGITELTAPLCTFACLDFLPR